MQALKQVFVVLITLISQCALAQGHTAVAFVDPAAAADPSVHKWFPYRPVDSPPSSPPKLVGVQITDDGIMLLTYDQDLTANCYAGNGLTVQPQNGTKRRVWFKVGFEEVTDASLKMMLATALTALHGGGQLHVMFNYADIVSGQCWGKYVAITKP